MRTEERQMNITLPAGLFVYRRLEKKHSLSTGLQNDLR